MEEKEDKIAVPAEATTPVVGSVVEALPNTQFRVNIGGDKEILAYLAGRMRINRIRVLVGDRVEVALDPYGAKGRIIKRL